MSLVSVSHVSPSVLGRLQDGGVGLRAWVFGFWVGFLGSSFLSPPSVFSSLPSTMTWAPCPHGVRTRGKKKLCGRKCFCHLSGHEMATLAAYDPRHGLHPWFRIEDHPSIHSCRGGAINFVRVWVRALARVRSRPALAKQYSSTRVTNHSCPPLCME